MTYFYIFLSYLLLSQLYLPSFAGTVEKYDRILARLEKAKQVKESDKTTDKKETAAKQVILGYENSKLPNLNGTWKLTRKTKKRMISPVISEPIVFTPCSARLPFEKRDFKNKEVIITSQGIDFYHVFTKEPVTTDVYYDPNQKKEIRYQNFEFKAVIDPEDLTYAYTTKVSAHLTKPTLARQLWLNGRLEYKKISKRKIVTEGYEVEYTPECHGFLLDEVEFTLSREKEGDFGPEEPEILLEQPVIANHEPIFPEEEEIIGENRNVPLDSAKDNSGIELVKDYKPYDSTTSDNLANNTGSGNPNGNSNSLNNIDKRRMIKALW